MSALFSPVGYARLDAVVNPGLLCAFDFDGTLTPLVALPEMSALPEDIRMQLVELSQYAPVAIITGRSVDDVRSRLGFEPDFIIGNHGSEGLPGWETAAERHRRLCHLWYEKISLWLEESDEFDPGIAIEDKTYSLSLHYRLARDPEQAATRLLKVLQQLTPAARIVTGKFVFNVVPEDAADKGVALEQLMREINAKSSIYIGDDVTDEDVFRLQRSDILTVRIESHIETAAEFFLPQRHDIGHLLDELITRLRGHNARNWTLSIPVSA